MSRERRRALLPFAALAAVAALLTAWLLASERIPRSADQAVVALMARHILEGRGHPVFYWGSTYGGTLEPHLLVPLFAVFGATAGAFRAFYVVLWAAFLAGTAAFTARFFGRTAALFAGAFLALPPFFLPYKLLTSDGAYASVALLGLASLWLACAADERLEAGRSATGLVCALGFTAGLGLWVTPVTLPLSGLAVAWLFVRPGRRPGAPAAACGLGAALLGAAPSLVWNLRHVGASATAPELSPATGRALLANLNGLFSASFPVFLGAARPHFTGEAGLAFPGAAVVAPLLVLALLLPAAAVARRDRRILLLLAVLAALSFAAVIARRLDPAEPRYLVAGYAALAPLLGIALARARGAGGGVRAAAYAGLALLLAGDVAGSVRATRHVGDVDDAQVTGPLGPLLADLRARGITRVWTNYWAAYRITFESGGDIVAAPIPLEDSDRNAAIQGAVRSSPDPAVVLLPPRDACLRDALIEGGGRFAEFRSGAFAIFHPLPAFARDAARAGALPMPAAAYRPVWGTAALPARLAPGAEAEGSARVRNAGPCTWMNNVRLVLSWSGPETREAAVSTPDRRVPPGGTADVTFRMRAPETPGAYRLTLDLEQAGIARFSSKGGAVLEETVLVSR